MDLCPCNTTLGPTHWNGNVIILTKFSSLVTPEVIKTTISSAMSDENFIIHDEVIKWKHFPRYWPFVRGIHRSPVNSPHKGQWREVLMFSLICAWINGWVNNREAGDLRRIRPHYDVTVMNNNISFAVKEHECISLYPSDTYFCVILYNLSIITNKCRINTFMHIVL